MARIYISSTYEDLQEERRAGMDAVLRLEHMPVGMEYATATENRPLDQCLEDVRSCQGYVGIFARRYGFVPFGRKKSITQLEYEEAGRHQIPRMIYCLADDAPWPAYKVDRDQRRIQALRDQLMADHIVASFSNPDELEAKVTASVSKEFAVGRTIPNLLPFLPDRDDQVFQLEDAVDAQRRSSDRPLACIIHGNHAESHESFLQRLTEITLPSVLSPKAIHGPVKAYHLDWPTGIRGEPRLYERLQRSLVHKTFGMRFESLGALKQFLSRHPGPVVVNTYLLTEEWHAYGTHAAKDFLNFWKAWPDLAPNQFLLILLFVKNQQKKNLGFFKRLRFRKLNRKITDALAGLHQIQIDGLTHKVLPRLEEIPQSDAENWARSDAVRRFCNSADVVPEIRRLYERWEQKQSTSLIPMDELASRLRGILYSFNDTQER